MKDIQFIFLSILLVFSSVACDKEDIRPNLDAEEEQDSTVTALFIRDKAAFPIGAAVGVGNLKSNAQYRQALTESYSQLTAEAAMKMWAIWRGENEYFWSDTDFLVDFAEEHGMEVHGHTLVWYKRFPEWFKEAQYDSATFELSVKEYIQTVVGRYKGRIRSWDVVNEAFNDDGTHRHEASPVHDTFRDPVAFYGRCFQYARDADPDAILFYNDYDAVLNTSKRRAIKGMIARFRVEDYPIDGVGDQFHIQVSTSQSAIEQGFKDLAGTKLAVHISELDVRVNVNKDDDFVYDSEQQEIQADKYQAIVEMYESLPQEQKFGISTWGVSDRYTWLTGWWHPKEYPLLYDRDFIKKPAYQGFLDGLN